MHACRKEYHPTAIFLQKPTRQPGRLESESPRDRGIAETVSGIDLLIGRMETKMSGSAGAGCKKRPPSRLQKHAPASLQLEQAAAGAGTGLGTGPAVWGDGRAAIPLLSPLVVSPTTPVWEADQAGVAARKEGGGDHVEGRNGAEQQRGAARHGHGGSSGAQDVSPRLPPAPAVGAGWRHPALSTPVAEPASLLPLFQSQCALEVHNAQQ